MWPLTFRALTTCFSWFSTALLGRRPPAKLVTRLCFATVNYKVVEYCSDPKDPPGDSKGSQGWAAMRSTYLYIYYLATPVVGYSWYLRAAEQELWGKAREQVIRVLITRRGIVQRIVCVTSFLLSKALYTFWLHIQCKVGTLLAFPAA